MPSLQTWRSLPLYYRVLDELERRGGRATDVELYRVLREEMELTMADLLKALMVLEMHGLVRVEVIKEDLRTVTLSKLEESRSEAVGG